LLFAQRHLRANYIGFSCPHQLQGSDADDGQQGNSNHHFNK
jgi:hypothetical protein